MTREKAERSARREFGKLQPLSPVAFLSAGTQSAGRQETTKLLALGSADEYLGAQVVVDYARVYPDDKDGPESLYLMLRMMRYGC